MVCKNYARVYDNNNGVWSFLYSKQNDVIVFV